MKHQPINKNELNNNHCLSLRSLFKWSGYNLNSQKSILKISEMLNSCKSSNQCRDHCVSKQVCALHLFNAMPITLLISTTAPSAGITQTKHFLWTHFQSQIQNKNHIKMGKCFKWKHLFSISLFDRICLISLSVFQVLWTAADQQCNNKQLYMKELWIWYFPAALCHL